MKTNIDAVAVLRELVAAMLSDGYVTIGSFRPALEKALKDTERAAIQPAGEVAAYLSGDGLHAISMREFNRQPKWVQDKWKTEGCTPLAAPISEATAPAAVVAGNAVQFMVNLSVDVIRALKNTDRQPLADLMEVAVRGLQDTQQEAKAEQVGDDAWEVDAKSAGLIVNGLAVSGARLNAFFNGHRAGFARGQSTAPSSEASAIVDHVYEHVGFKDRDALISDVSAMIAPATERFDAYACAKQAANPSSQTAACREYCGNVDTCFSSRFNHDKVMAQHDQVRAEERTARTPAIAGSIAEDMKFIALLDWLLDAYKHGDTGDLPRFVAGRNELFAYLDTIIQGASNEPR